MLIDDYKQCLNDINKKKYIQIITEYNISELLISLDKKNANQIYPYTLDDLSNTFHQIRTKFNEDTMEVIRKIVLLKCAIANWNDIFSNKYTKSIQEQYKQTFERFLKICNHGQGWGQNIDDVYWKDLAMARQQIFPAGAGIVEAYSGIGWRQGLSLNISQSIQFLSLISKANGKKGYYQIHTHTPELSKFNEQGWIECYIRIAGMLKKNKKIKGIFRSSWFFDPKLEKISHRLMYLQKIPLTNGAKIFHVEKDNSGNALIKSKTRMKLYSEGKYIPQIYLLIWLRNDLIDWADRNNKK